MCTAQKVINYSRRETARRLLVVLLLAVFKQKAACDIRAQVNADELTASLMMSFCVFLRIMYAPFLFAYFVLLFCALIFYENM